MLPTAASRAVESEEEHPLVADPLAAQMAGAKALAASRRRAQASPPCRPLLLRQLQPSGPCAGWL